MEKTIQNDITKLNKGDYFYIVCKGKAQLYIFENFSANSIICVNPITSEREYIPKILYGGRVSNIEIA